MNLKKNKNLIICLTPLQMLIADSILRMKENEEYTFICICYGYNDKYDLYFNRINDKASYSFLYQVLSVNKIGRFFDLLRYKKNIVKKLDKKFNNVYFASIDNPFVQLALSTVEYNNMISFDDGTANLWVNSIYNKPVDRGVIQRITSKLVGISVNEEFIKARIFRHYTIFKNNMYLKGKSEFLPLFNLDFEKEQNSKVIKIFLGQPLSDYNFPIFNKENVEYILKILDVDFYFPHPREKEEITSVETIKTRKIFEDYIVELLTLGYVVNVYTFFSSAILTISGLENVQRFAVLDKQIFNHFSDLFAIFKENGIELIELDFDNANNL